MVKKPYLKVQSLQYKFLDWKWPPPSELFPKIHPIWKRASSLSLVLGCKILFLRHKIEETESGMSSLSSFQLFALIMGAHIIFRCLKTLQTYLPKFCRLVHLLIRTNNQQLKKKKKLLQYLTSGSSSELCGESNPIGLSNEANEHRLRLIDT